MIAVRYPHALDHRGPVGVIKTSAVDRGKVYSLHIHDPEGIDYNPSQAALEPEWMEYSDTTIDTVVPRASVATPEQRRVDTFPIPTIVGDLLRSNAEDATIGALPRCSSVCLNFESNLKR
ncbi:unnamed protein product, partial [marine sediment metagenome]